MKGMGLFLEAAHLLLQAGANATFLIAGGDRDPRQHLMTHRLIQSYGFPPGTVHIVGDGGSGSGSSSSGPSGSSGVPQGTSGFVSSRDVPAVLMCMDVYVAPYLSPSCETQGIAVLEAMAMQRTVVHLGVGGLQDYTVHMHNSVEAEQRTGPGLAAALAVAGNRTLRAQLGVAAREDVLLAYDSRTLGPRNADSLRALVASAQVARSQRTLNAGEGT